MRAFSSGSPARHAWPAHRVGRGPANLATVWTIARAIRLVTQRARSTQGLQWRSASAHPARVRPRIVGTGRQLAGAREALLWRGRKRCVRRGVSRTCGLKRLFRLCHSDAMGLAHGKPAGNTTDMLVRRPSSARWLDVADIPLSQLRDAIEELSVEREDGSTGFLKEFATLESRTATQHGREAHKEAKKATNVVLNRYNDVWPNDKHRVTISRNEEGTDCEWAGAWVACKHHATHLFGRYQCQLCGLAVAAPRLHHGAGKRLRACVWWRFVRSARRSFV